MAITYTTQKASGSAASGTSIVVTVPAGGFTSGNHLIVVPNNQDPGFDISSVSAGGNTYAQHVRVTETPITFSCVILGSIYLASGLAAAASITFTTATSVGGVVMLYEFSGLDSAGPFDQTANQLINFDTAYTSGATPATTVADELVFGMNMANSSARSFTPDGAFSELDDAAWFGSWKMQTQYEIVSSTGAQTETATADSATKGFAVCGTFKAAPGGAQNQLAWIRA